MATADISGIVYFLPLISFLLVFVISYAVLVSTKLVQGWFLQVLVPFLIATVFVTAISARDYVLTIIPWFAVLVVSLFLVLMFTGFLGKHAEAMHKPIAIVFVVLLALAFLISAIFIFQPYYSNNPLILGLYDWTKDSKVFGSLLLIVVSIVVSWVLVKSKK